MVKDYAKFLRLSRILNSSFGSGGPGDEMVNGMRVRLDPIDDGHVRARFITIASFKSDLMLQQLTRKYKDEAIEMFRAAIKEAARLYKEEFDGSITLTLDAESLEDSVEFVHMSQYTALSRAFYRVVALVKVS
jgi:hypothetical protein